MCVLWACVILSSVLFSFFSFSLFLCSVLCTYNHSCPCTCTYTMYICTHTCTCVYLHVVIAACTCEVSQRLIVHVRECMHEQCTLYMYMYMYIHVCTNQLAKSHLSLALLMALPLLCRDVEPSHGFVLLNRLSSDNLHEVMERGMEYRVQGQFVLFNKHSGGNRVIFMYRAHVCMYMYIYMYVHVHVQYMSVCEIKRKLRWP